MPSLLNTLRNFGKPKQVQMLSPEALDKIQNAKYGVLANNKQAQQQFINKQIVAHQSTAQMLPGQLIPAGKQVAKATGLAGARIGVGARQGVSGLYDLASKGTGTSRVTDMLNHAAEGIDQTATQDGINPAYHIMQAALTPASFYAPGGLIKALSAVPKFEGAANVVSAAGRTAPWAIKASEGLQEGGAASRIAGQALQGVKPMNAVNAAYGTGMDLGRQTGQGQQVTPLSAGLTAGANLATPLALPAFGQAGIEVGKASPGVIKAGATKAGKAISTTRGKLIDAQATKQGIRSRVKQLDSESAAHQRQMDALPIDNYKAAEVLQRKIDRNNTMKQQLTSGKKR